MAARRWMVPFARCFSKPRLGGRACALALAHARQRRPSAAVASLCVRTVDSRGNEDESWLRNADDLVSRALESEHALTGAPV